MKVSRAMLLLVRKYLRMKLSGGAVTVNGDDITDFMENLLFTINESLNNLVDIFKLSVDVDTTATVDSMGYNIPEPSLCDTCKNAYYVGGGSCGFTKGGISFDYRQRYCAVSEVEKRKPGAGCIHAVGHQECEFYSIAPSTSAAE